MKPLLYEPVQTGTSNTSRFKRIERADHAILCPPFGNCQGDKTILLAYREMQKCECSIMHHVVRVDEPEFRIADQEHGRQPLTDRILDDVRDILRTNYFVHGEKVLYLLDQTGKMTCYNLNLQGRFDIEPSSRWILILSLQVEHRVSSPVHPDARRARSARSGPIGWLH